MVLTQWKFEGMLVYAAPSWALVRMVRARLYGTEDEHWAISDELRRRERLEREAERRRFRE